MARTPSHPPLGKQPIRGSVKWYAALATIAVCGAAAVVPKAAQAASSAAITISLTGSTYSVSIFNGTSVELGEVDFTFAGSPSLTNLTAPAGFITNYDQGSANIVFAENTGSFSPGATVSPFTFTASTAPTLKTIEGLDDLGESLTANAPFSLPTVSGTSKTDTISVGGAIAPEPGSLSLFALGATTSLGLIARRRIGGNQRTTLNILKG
jgi:hypothetical protein